MYAILIKVILRLIFKTPHILKNLTPTLKSTTEIIRKVLDLWNYTSSVKNAPIVKNPLILKSTTDHTHKESQPIKIFKKCPIKNIIKPPLTPPLPFIYLPDQRFWLSLSLPKNPSNSTLLKIYHRNNKLGS